MSTMFFYDQDRQTFLCKRNAIFDNIYGKSVVFTFKTISGLLKLFNMKDTEFVWNEYGDKIKAKELKDQILNHSFVIFDQKLKFN